MKTKSYRTPKDAYRAFLGQLSDWLSNNHPGIYCGDAEDCADTFGQSIDELLCWPGSGYSHFAFGVNGEMQGCVSMDEAVWSALAFAGVAERIVWNECESCNGWHSIEWTID